LIDLLLVGWLVGSFVSFGEIVRRVDLASSGEAYRKEPKRAPNSDSNSAFRILMKFKNKKFNLKHFNLTSLIF